MYKKNIAQLITFSLTNNNLDSEKIKRISNQLSRQNLRAYISGLRKWVKENTVFVEYAIEPSATVKKEFENAYAGKRIIFQKNPDLLIGVRVIENDTIYDINLKNSLDNINNFINQ